MKISVLCKTGLARALLGGAALSVLAAAPSPAQPIVAPQLKLYSGSYHPKTDIRDPKTLAQTSTQTLTFTGTLSESEYYRNWVELWALRAPPDCARVKANFPRRTSAARIKVIETEGDYELFYKLESKRATSDSVSGEIKGRNCGGNPNLNLFIKTDLSISH